MLSYQSPMPAAAGTPRYEKPELWFGAANWHGGFCHAPTPTPAGDKPPRYIFSFRHRPSVYNSARFAGGEPASRLIEGHIFVRNDEGMPRMTNERLLERSIPDRSPGHAFTAKTK